MCHTSSTTKRGFKQIGLHGGDQTTRYFVIALPKSDRRLVMWYKPNAGQEHLYPTMQDSATLMPLFDLVNGDKKFRTDMNGIEIFSDLPSGEPHIQKYKADRLNVSATQDVMKQAMQLHPNLISSQTRAWWDARFSWPA